jgi:hypothetical protein
VTCFFGAARQMVFLPTFVQTKVVALVVFVAPARGQLAPDFAWATPDGTTKVTRKMVASSLRMP